MKDYPNLFRQTDDFTQITEVLRNHDACDISFYEVNGTGRGERDSIQEIVEGCMAGKSNIMDYERRTKSETILPDCRFIRRQTVGGFCELTTPTYETLTTDNAVLLIVDHQVGLVAGSRDPDLQDLRKNIVGDL